MEKFRKLKANEIECRVQSVTAKGVILLLYKDARCDMNLLDETVGPLNWKREHLNQNANCIVSIWCTEKQEWVSKEDTGTESNTEKQKGLASDSFKRACFNWGIGRELYTSPFIWVSAETGINIAEYNGKFKCNDNFEVAEIIYDNSGNIDGLAIAARINYVPTIVYAFGKTTHKVAKNKKSATQKSTPKEIPQPNLATQGQLQNMYKLGESLGFTRDEINAHAMEKFKVSVNQITVQQVQKFIVGYTQRIEEKEQGGKANE